jgi:aminoglycoside N3'-acetyltransferase
MLRAQLHRRHGLCVTIGTTACTYAHLAEAIHVIASSSQSSSRRLYGIFHVVIVELDKQLSGRPKAVSASGR